MNDINKSIEKESSFLLYITHIKSFFQSLKEELYEALPEQVTKNLTPLNIFFKIINGSILLFLLSIYTYIPFIVYMDQNNIFPYDFFTEEGIFAVNLFSVYILIIALFMSAGLSGGLVAYVALKRNKLKIHFIVKLLIIINFITLACFVLIMILDTSDRFGYLVFLMVLSFVISVNIVFLFFTTSIQQFIVMISSLGFILPTILFMILPTQTTTLVSGILSNFGIGGNIEAKVTYVQSNNKSDRSIEGELIFLSPKNIYIKTQTDSVLIIERKNTEITTYNKWK